MAGTSLRERKKDIVRQDVIATAKRLFEERGYDSVTVAEIADVANISVKTLFTYFRSKEDLLFQDNSLIDEILKDLAARDQETPAKTVAATLIRLIKQGGTPAESLSAFQRGFGNSDALQGRLLKLWLEYEEAIATLLAKESDLNGPTAEMRYLAAQLVTLIRAITWKETLDMIANDRSKGRTVLSKWIEKLATDINKAN